MKVFLHVVGITIGIESIGRSSRGRIRDGMESGKNFSQKSVENSGIKAFRVKVGINIGTVQVGSKSIIPVGRHMEESGMR